MLTFGKHSLCASTTWADWQLGVYTCCSIASTYYIYDQFFQTYWVVLVLLLRNTNEISGPCYTPPMAMTQPNMLHSPLSIPSTNNFHREASGSRHAELVAGRNVDSQCKWTEFRNARELWKINDFHCLSHDLHWILTYPRRSPNVLGKYHVMRAFLPLLVKCGEKMSIGTHFLGPQVSAYQVRAQQYSCRSVPPIRCCGVWTKPSRSFGQRRVTSPYVYIRKTRLYTQVLPKNSVAVTVLLSTVWIILLTHVTSVTKHWMASDVSNTKP